MKIKITCQTSKSIPVSQLSDFQGNLKRRDLAKIEKLKQSILKYGFSFPMFVWENNILDGHQRIFAVKELLKEGHSIDSLPAVEIEAKERKEAAEKLLLLQSRYAEITRDGLNDFIFDFKIDLSALDSLIEIPGINLDIKDEILSEKNDDQDIIENLPDRIDDSDDEIDEVKKEIKKKSHISMSTCYNNLRVNKTEFFALYRNNEMDLEKLKQDIKNTYLFVYPLRDYLKENSIDKIILAPPGDRSKRNGFHFITEVCNKIDGLQIFTPFKNIDNHIKKVGDAPGDCYIVDDIVTRGRTIFKLNSLQENRGIIALITNC